MDSNSTSRRTSADWSRSRSFWRSAADGGAGLVGRLEPKLPGAALGGGLAEGGRRRQRVGAVREVDEDGRGDGGHGACCVGACCAAALACATTGGRRREISEM